MLISCFQCRQQLDVPEDSAGKRVRCPHCQYVIVVPAKARPLEADESAAPVTALPSMDLDADADRSAPATKVAAQPLPPYVPPASQPGKTEPTKPKAPVDDDLPPLPPIDKAKSRRRPMSPLPSQGPNWRRIIGIGVFIGIVIIGIIVVAASSTSHRRRGNQVVFNNPQVQVQPPIQIPRGRQFMQGPFNQGGFPQVFQPIPANLWRTIENRDHRFKADMPGLPVQNQPNLPFGVMTVFSVQQGDWEFSVAHRVLPAQEMRGVNMPARFNELNQKVADWYGVVPRDTRRIVLRNGREAGDWKFSFPDNRLLHVRTFFVPDGKNFHQYVLTVKTPPHPADVDRFFNAFTVLSEAMGQSIIEEFDTPLNGDRRDNELISLVLHPKEHIAVTGTIGSRLRVLRTNHDAPPNANIEGDREALQKEFEERVDRKFLDEKLQVIIQENKPIEQLAIAQDGKWLSVVVGGEIQCWRDWANSLPKEKTSLQGTRCAFTKDQHLLVANKDGIREFTLDPHVLVFTLAIHDLKIGGFALSPDEKTLAVFGGKTIMFWNWPDKKLLSRTDAHGAAVTGVAFSPDSKTLASASADRTIKLWNVDTRAERATLKQHAWTVWSLAFTPDGKHLASGGLDGMLLLWSVEANPPRLVWAQSHQFPVRAVAFDHDGKHLYFTCKEPASPDAAGQTRYVRQLRKIPFADIKPNPPEAERLVALDAGLHLPATSKTSYFSPDGTTYVSTNDTIDRHREDTGCCVWDTTTATLKHSHPMRGEGVLSPDGKWFVMQTAGPLNQVSLLNIETNRTAPTTVTINVANGFPPVLFAADSKSFWVQRNQDFVRYEIQIPAKGDDPLLVQRQTIKLKQPNDPRNVRIHRSMDHKTFLVERYSLEGIVQTRTLYSSADGKEVQGKPMPGIPSSYPRLRRVAGAQLELQDYLQGSSQAFGQQLQVLGVHTIQPQRKYAVTTEVLNQQTPRTTLWDLQERRPLLTLRDPGREITAVHFSPDGKTLALVTNASWTRIVPIDWLLERESLLPSPANEVAGP